MKRLRISILKEALLLSRDIEGVILLFVMPLILVIIIALLQHKTFQNASEMGIPTVIVDFDGDFKGRGLREGISKSEMFGVTEITDGNKATLDQARADVAHGKYQIGIYIPSGTSKALKYRAKSLIRQQLPGVVNSDSTPEISNPAISLFFDPVTKESFKNLTRGALSECSAKMETELIFETYSKVVDALTNQISDVKMPENPAIDFKEDLVSEYNDGIMPNVVQHSIPAWTLFGMFLICIPIAGNIIKERREGCMAKLKTIPVSYLNIMTGKVVVFVAVCILQAFLIILVGMFLMPSLGLPALQIHGNWFAVFLMSLSCGLAATGFGIVVGTIATTQIQASTFGAVSSVILAAIGGVWIPVIIMSDAMRTISKFSPMNWGITGYYEVFLRNGSWFDIAGEALKLILFSAACLTLSLIFRKYRS